MMKKQTLHLIPCSLTLVFSLVSQTILGQTIIFTAVPIPQGPAYLYQLDLATCTYCPILDIPLSAAETLVLPNGNVVVSSIAGTFIYDLPNSTPIVSFPGQLWNGAIIHPNGTIYVVTSSGTQLSTFNPSTNTLTTIGSFPAGLYIDELFTVGNTLYGFGYQGPGTRPVYEINVTNPSVSVQVYPFSSAVSSATTTPGGQVITSWAGGGSVPASDFNLYNLTTNTWTTLCQIPPQLVSGISSVPAGAPIPSCVCLLTSAGTPVQTTANVCAPDSYTASFNNNTFLFPEDGVSYILYTDASNPTGSVLFQNNTGVFPFLPPMTPNIAYYISRVVGDLVSGQVSLTDPCLSVSPPTAVTWRPRPSLISMSASNPNLCAGSCTEITANFAGTPPLFVYAQLYQGSTAVSPLIVSGVPGNSATYSVCAPTTVPSGPTQYVICGLLDQYCSN